MGSVVEFSLDLVTGIARAPGVFLAGILGERVAALDHKTLDHAMKRRAIIKAFFGESFEIFDGLGRDVRPEFDDHFAFSGIDDCNFVHKFLKFELHSILWAI